MDPNAAPTSVLPLAGFTVGLAWATFCALGMEAVRFFRSKKPEVAKHERGVAKGTEPLQDAISGDPPPSAS